MKKTLILLALCLLSPVRTMWAQEADSSATAPVAVSAAAGVDAQAVATMAAAAQADYDAEHYAAAIEAYEAIAAQVGVSADLYYNLAGAYHKQKQYARAILNYESCLLLDPSNGDARVNLELAQMQTTDKIESITPPVFVVWSHALRDTMSASAWSWTAIGLFLLFVLGLSAYFFVRRVAVRKVGFYGSLLAIACCGVAIHYASAQNDRLTLRSDAIVMTPTVTVRSSPAESGTQLVPLHEGTKVHVRQTLGGWSEIELSDGNVGWLPSADLEII